MNVLGGVVLLVCVLTMVYCVITMIRNQRLYKYRIGLIDAAHEIAMMEINDGTWDGRNYTMIESASYNEMVMKIWRSFDSFYPPDWEVFAWRDGHVYVPRGTRAPIRPGHDTRLG